MENDKQIHDQKAIFAPFRSDGNETSLYIVYKVLMAKYDSDQALVLLKDFCLTSISAENQRRGLELLYMSSFFNEVEQMIEINRKSENNENHQWAQMYEMIIERRQSGERTDPFKILATLDKIEPFSKDVELLKLFMTLYSYLDLRQYGKVGSYIDTLYELNNKIPDPLMAMYFQERLEEFLMFYHFMRNELILSRRYGYRLLNKMNNTFKHSVVHKSLALSYALESYEQAIYHANEALQIAEKYGYTMIIETVKRDNIPFIAAVNGRYEGITTSDPVEQAHLNIARGNIDEAVAYLESIDQPSPFQEYYLGKALNDIDRLLSSYHRFTRAGYYFAAQFPIKEIKRLRKIDRDDQLDQDRLA